MLASLARFQMRPDNDGWTVFDNCTGLAVVIMSVAQTGLTLMDADELVELLQRRADAGDRRIYE
jgi:hypothetical protein